MPQPPRLLDSDREGAVSKKPCLPDRPGLSTEIFVIDLMTGVTRLTRGGLTTKPIRKS